MPTKYGYPTEDELNKLKNWDGIKDPKGLIDFLEEIWHWPELGFTKKKGRDQLFKKPCIKLYLSTGGWSGNEDIIKILQETFFWHLFWVNSHRGGHYEFEIPINWARRKLTLW